MIKAFNKKILAVVVTYNRKELLSECLDALLKQECSFLDILIVDNASTDGTYDYIEHYLKNKRVIYENTGENLGGAGGFNYGMKHGVKLGYDYIWLMDDDTIVKKDSLTKLLEADQKLKGKYGFLYSMPLWIDGNICRMNKPRYKKGEKDKEYPRLNFGSFVSFFIKTEVIKEVGLPIKEFFIWGDDVEYSHRIQKLYDCYLVKDSEVIHKTKTNDGSNIAKDDERMDRYKYSFRNEAFINRYRNFNEKLYAFAKVCYLILLVLFKSKKNKFKKIKIIIDNTIEGTFNFNPKIEYIRDERKVLEVFAEPFSNGGQESFIMNIFRNINKNTIHMDFYTPFYCDNDIYKNEIEHAGCKIYSGNGRFTDNHGNKKDFINNLKAFLKKHKYEIIHIHSGSIFALFYGAKIAKKSGAKDVIIHSHCGGFNNLKYRLIKTYTNLFMKKYVDYYFACSNLAAEWKFPKKIINNKEYTLINNGINTKKMYYNPVVRDEYKHKLDIIKKQVFIHVGRFSIQKNHLFLIDILNEIHKLNNNSVLLLVGTGETLSEVKEKVKELNLDKCVKFLGIRTDINELLNASDAFILPSHFEGLPVVGVEAQATGLPVFTSTNVTKELPIENLSFYYSLEDSPSTWAKNILKELKSFKRRNTTNEMINAKYDIKDSAKELQELYLRMK